MPVQEFALDTIGIQRIQIFQASGEGNITILLNKSIVGSISNQELIAGKEFALKDGSFLRVQRISNNFQVMCNGLPLLLMSQAEIAAAETRATMERAKEVEKERAKRDLNVLPLQRVSTSESIAQQNLGYIIIMCGGLLALIVFFSLPYTTLGPFFLTGSQIANNNGFLWLEPIIAGVIVAIAGLQMLLSLNGTTESDKAISAIIILSLLAFVVLLISSLLQPNIPNYVRLASISISLSPVISPSYGSGFWLYIVGMGVVLAGSVIQIRKS